MRALGILIGLGISATASYSAENYKFTPAQRSFWSLQPVQKPAVQKVAKAVFQSTFGGKEVVVLMERDPAKNGVPSSYRLLATSKTPTMEKELKEAGAEGCMLVGLTIGKTAIGGFPRKQ